jgi:hypothetical protein
MFPPGNPADNTTLQEAISLLSSPLHDNWVKAATLHPNLFAVTLCSFRQLDKQTEDFSLLQLSHNAKTGKSPYPG